MGVDVSRWNLGLPLALLAGCTRIEDLTDAGAPIDSSSTLSDDGATPTTNTEGSTLPDPTTDASTMDGATDVDPTAPGCECGPEECCIDQQCIFVPCAPRCTQEQCCAYACPPVYECSYDEQCQMPGTVCSGGACIAVEELEPDCEVQFGVEQSIPLMGAPIAALAFIDADQDPLRDLLVGDAYQLSVVPANASVPLTIDEGIDVAALAVADLDADGDEDIAVADRAEGTVRVLLQEAGYTFSLASVTPVPGIAAVLLDDGDIDGLPDAIVRDDVGGVGWLRNIGGGALEPRLPLPFDGVTSVATGRLDPDALTSVALYQPGGVWVTGAAEVDEPNTKMLFEEPAYSLSRIVTVGDYDGTGIDDVITLHAVAGSTIATSWSNPVVDNFAHRSWWFGSVRVAVRGDVDVDGYDDLVVAGDDFQLVIAHGGAAQATSDVIACVATIPTMTSSIAVAVGDFSGDGRPDIATSDGAQVVVLVQEP